MQKISWNPEDVYKQISNYIDNNYGEKKLIAYIWVKETKEVRTLAQNNTWYKLFWGISKHLGVPVDEVKIYFMIWCFGSKKITLSKNTMDIPIIYQTHLLTKEQGIFLIDILISFVKIKNIPITITPREIQSLYDSYN